jgi:hypothetical protein
LNSLGPIWSSFKEAAPRVTASLRFSSGKVKTSRLPRRRFHYGTEL